MAKPTKPDQHNKSVNIGTIRQTLELFAKDSGASMNTLLVAAFEIMAEKYPDELVKRATELQSRVTAIHRLAAQRARASKKG